MRRPVPASLLLGLGLVGPACGGGDENDADGTTGIDSLSSESSTVTSTSNPTSATTTSMTTTSMPTTSGPTTTTTTTTEADTTESADDNTDSEPHDECELTETFDGPDGSEWPSHWTPVGGIAIADVQGGRGRLVPTTGAYAVSRIVTPLDCTDVEVTFSFEMADAATQGFGLYVRQNGGYLQQTDPFGEGYSMFMEAYGTPRGISVWREINGVEQRIETVVPMTIEANVVYRVRFRVTQQNGSTTRLQTRFWPDGASEPDAWQVDRTDQSASLQGAGGHLAIDSYSSMTMGTAVDAFVDDIVVTAAR